MCGVKITTVRQRHALPRDRFENPLTKLPTENFATTPIVTRDAYDYHEASAPMSEVLVRG